MRFMVPAELRCIKTGHGKFAQSCRAGCGGRIKPPKPPAACQ